LHLLCIRAQGNLSALGIFINLEYIMNTIHYAERVVQGLLAVTIVFALGLAVQLSLVY
jgi:hypothetical protein